MQVVQCDTPRNLYILRIMRERARERKGNEVKIQAKTRQDKNRRMAQMLYCQAMTPLTNCVYTLHTHRSSCIPQPIRIH